MTRTVAALSGALALVFAGSAVAADAPGVRGDYVEARTADVFTGPCFSNAEIFLTGHQAVLAWKVNAGTFRGVDLGGLTVAAAVRGTTTFSEDKPEQARAVVIVDDKADARQREALVALAKQLGGARLQNVVAVTSAPMRLMVEKHEPASASSGHVAHGMPHAPRASFWAGGLAQIVTRPLDERDHFCGNEVVAYQPLSRGVEALPAYTLGHQFKGTGLGTRWDDPNCRSAFVGHFAL